jgi:hypothetical protein
MGAALAFGEGGPEGINLLRWPKDFCKAAFSWAGVPACPVPDTFCAKSELQLAFSSGCALHNRAFVSGNFMREGS